MYHRYIMYYRQRQGGIRTDRDRYGQTETDMGRKEIDWEPIINL